MTSNIRYALILAAGFGSRLRPLTNHIPKALVEVGGIPMLKRTLDILNEFDFEKIFINTHYHSNQISDFIRNNKYLVTELYEPNILETGGTLKLLAKNYADVGEILVINADSLFTNLDHAISDLSVMWNKKTMDGLFTLVPSVKRKTSSDFAVSSNQNLIYPIPKDHEGYTFTSPYIIKPNILLDSELDKFSIIRDFIYPKFNEIKNLYGYVTTEDWIDIGTPEDLERANKMFG